MVGDRLFFSYQLLIYQFLFSFGFLTQSSSTTFCFPKSYLLLLFQYIFDSFYCPLFLYFTVILVLVNNNFINLLYSVQELFYNVIVLLLLHLCMYTGMSDVVGYDNNIVLALAFQMNSQFKSVTNLSCAATCFSAAHGTITHITLSIRCQCNIKSGNGNEAIRMRIAVGQFP